MEMTKDKTMDAFLETIADIVDAIPAVEASGGSLALQRAKISAGKNICLMRYLPAHPNVSSGGHSRRPGGNRP